MYDYVIYKNNQGKDEITLHIKELANKSQTSKSHRVELSKIFQCLEILKQYGTRAGEPYMKHLDNGLWELRPTDNRIIYAFWRNNTFVLLHHFKKKTQKTPQREIDQAKRNLKDWIERGGK